MNLSFCSLLGLTLLSPWLRASDLTAEALPILQARYVGYAGLQVQPNDRLDNLLARSQGGISWASPAAPVPPMAAKFLLGGAIYCRLVSFQSPANDFAAQLKTWVGQGVQGIVLDLRSNATPDDFAGAARLAAFFTPPGTPLFAIKDAQEKSLPYATALDSVPVSEPLAVLIDNRTSGAAEALAASLKAHGALLLGQPTAGFGAEFEDRPLAGGQVLRYLTGQVMLADGTPLWHHAVQPDIGLAVDASKETAILALIAQDRVLDVVGEIAASHRLSEASLVRGEAPEVDAYLVPLDKSASPIPQDACLVAALDSLKAIRLSREASVSSKIPSTVQ